MIRKEKPHLSFWQIWNLTFGFLGIQFGFALQNANASWILQTFGADVEHLSWFWLAAPITGLLVQPIIGFYSDKTWGRLGRRRPYFLFGAIFASIGLILMPNASVFAAILPPMYIGAGFLMIMDASFNVSMEPFRALVADNLPSEQRTLGYSIQTILIGVGAVVGSGLPYMLAEWFNISKIPGSQGEIPDNLLFSFYIGSFVLITSILVTVFKTKEYSPEELAAFNGEAPTIEKKPMVIQIIKDFASMPKTMKQLGLVQFFSWFALFSMWVFSTPAIAQQIFKADITNASSEEYINAGNWVGILFMTYNGVAAIYAIFLNFIAKNIGRKLTHALSLLIGSVGFFSIYFIDSPNTLLLSFVGIGIAWASILAMPYSILAGALPAHKMGIYMGIFNFFIVFPQIVNGLFGGPIVKRFYDSQAIYALIGAGVCLLIAAVSVVFVQDKDETVKLKV